MTTIAIVRRPGFRDHRAHILSTHRTVDAARKALKRHAWLERGVRVQPCEIVVIDRAVKRGDIIICDGADTSGMRSI